MTPETFHPLLQKSIQGLDFSKEFKAMAKANGYKTLIEILEDPIYDLPTKSLSGYRILKELLDFLDQHGLHSVIPESE